MHTHTQVKVVVSKVWTRVDPYTWGKALCMNMYIGSLNGPCQGTMVSFGYGQIYPKKKARVLTY
jgi:hypothetical protein